MTNSFPGVGKITYGRDNNFFQRASITATSFGAASTDGYQPDMVITFSTQFIVFINTTASASNKVLEYSFNGTTVHGELDVATGSQTVKIEMPFRVVSKIWFRIKSGSTGPLTVTVQAW
jgi:hypothetical protein